MDLQLRVSIHGGKTSCEPERGGKAGKADTIWEEKASGHDGRENEWEVKPDTEPLMKFTFQHSELCNRRLFTYPALVWNKGQIY